MRLVEVVNILGAHVQTTRKHVGNFPTAKLQAALRDCEAIRALPCDGSARAQILATKVLPQIAFAPQLNFLPKRLLTRLQMWRSKHILLCIVHKAHKLDPFLFRAVATIIESARHLRTSAYARQTRQAMAQSWMTQFGQACHILDINWCSPFGFSLLDAPSVDFLEFSLTDLKCILKSLAANKCYHTASLMPRKDVQKAAGFLDLSLTLSAKKKLAKIPNDNFSFLFHWESAITGCTITADRLAASGLVESSCCRFCGRAKESLQHFVDECTELPAELLQPSTSYFLGPNFNMLGIAELPVDVIRAKLRVSAPSELAVAAWDEPSTATCHVWTDGPVQLAHHPWLTWAAFAVVAENEELLAAGQVWHWRLSSYSAELWAVLTAFAIAAQPLVVHTDSLTIVNQFNELLRTGHHANWWSFLHMLIHQRRGYCDMPLQLMWCPAHLLERIPATSLTDDEATAAGSNKRDILLNRMADEFAKHQILKSAVSQKAELRTKENDVFARQLWLSKLNRTCKKPEKNLGEEILVARPFCWANPT